MRRHGGKWGIGTSRLRYWERNLGYKHIYRNRHVQDTDTSFLLSGPRHLSKDRHTTKIARTKRRPWARCRRPTPRTTSKRNVCWMGMRLLGVRVLIHGLAGCLCRFEILAGTNPCADDCRRENTYHDRGGHRSARVNVPCPFLRAP